MMRSAVGAICFGGVRVLDAEVFFATVECAAVLLCELVGECTGVIECPDDVVCVEFAAVELWVADAASFAAELVGGFVAAEFVEDFAALEASVLAPELCCLVCPHTIGAANKTHRPPASENPRAARKIIVASFRNRASSQSQVRRSVAPCFLIIGLPVPHHPATE